MCCVSVSILSKIKHIFYTSVMHTLTKAIDMTNNIIVNSVVLWLCFCQDKTSTVIAFNELVFQIQSLLSACNYTRINMYVNNYFWIFGLANNSFKITYIEISQASSQIIRLMINSKFFFYFFERRYRIQIEHQSLKLLKLDIYWDIFV